MKRIFKRIKDDPAITILQIGVFVFFVGLIVISALAFWPHLFDEKGFIVWGRFLGFWVYIWILIGLFATLFFFISALDE